MENNVNRLFKHYEFLEIYETCKNDKSTMENLISMQISDGIDERKAAENADTMINAIASREAVRGMVNDDAKATAEHFLDESELSIEELHMVYFGLKLYHDDYLSGRMKDGADINELFDEYYAEYGNDPSVTEDYLKEQILELLSDYSVSPSTMKHISNSLKNSGDVLATSAALGEEGLRLKCVASMYMFLKNKDLTIADAANMTCTSIEIQAIADALSTAQVTRERAKVLLSGVIATMVLGGFAVLLLKPLLSKVLVAGFATQLFEVSKGCVLLGGFCSLLGVGEHNELFEDIAASVKYHLVIKKEESKAAEAMLALAEEEEAVTIEYEDVDNEDDIFDADENPQPLNSLS